MEWTDNTSYDYYAGDQLLPRQVRTLSKIIIKYLYLFLFSILELRVWCRYFSIARGLHNYRAEGRNILSRRTKQTFLLQLLPRILPVLMVNSRPEIRAKFDSPDFVEKNEAMLKEEFSKYFQVRNLQI